MASAEIENIFNDILERAKVLDPGNARKWFDKLTISRLDGGSLKIGCPDEVTDRERSPCSNSLGGRMGCRASWQRGQINGGVDLLGYSTLV